MSLHYSQARGRWRWEFDRSIKQPDGSTKQIRKTKTFPKGTTEAQAHILAAKLETEKYLSVHLLEDETGWAAYVNELYNRPKSWLYIAAQKAKNRAGKVHREFTLTPEIVKEMMLKSGGRCAVTGVKFDLSECENKKKRPFFHSLDRIKASQGYTPTNTRIVCYAANVAMMDWGEAIFNDLATGYVLRKYSLGKLLLS